MVVKRILETYCVFLNYRVGYVLHWMVSRHSYWPCVAWLK